MNLDVTLYSKVGNHQNIVRLMGVCLDEDSVSIVSQFYPQGSCYKVFLKDRRDVTWLQLLKVAKGAAAGVMHLHAENYIHRFVVLTGSLHATQQPIQSQETLLALFSDALHPSVSCS